MVVMLKNPLDLDLRLYMGREKENG